jgi:sugar transferase (PEP-CTERM/EpsH1 system associated)
VVVKPLRVLFICPYLPSLVRVRPFNLIKALAARGHQVTLLAVEPPGEDASGLQALRDCCRHVETVRLPRWRSLWNGLRALPGDTPFQAAYSRCPRMSALVRQIRTRGEFDVTHIEHLRGAELGGGPNGVPVIFDSVDSISLLFDRARRSGPTWRSRVIAYLDLARTRRYESGLTARFLRVLVTSPQDREALAQLCPGPEAYRRLVVLPNGVDLDYFSPVAAPRDPATLIFTGKMSYHANVAAALDLAHLVMPRIWAHVPDARLVLAGKDPGPELLHLAADPRITVTGTVPDLRPFLAHATVAVSPIRYGVGIQNKVLEAMAMGTPVVATPQATAALDVKSGRDLLIASTPEAIASAVISLLIDPALRRHIGRTGRRFVETRHDWNAVAEKLEQIYRDAMAETGGLQPTT